MKKLCSLVFISLFALMAVFAKDYYVCLGSYSKVENAINFMETTGIVSEIQSADVKGKKVYRVVYAVRCDSLNKAEKLKQNIENQHSELKNLWIYTKEDSIVLQKTADYEIIRIADSAKPDEQVVLPEEQKKTDDSENKTAEMEVQNAVQKVQEAKSFAERADKIAEDRKKLLEDIKKSMKE